MNIIGNKNRLFSMHGDIEVDKALQTMQNLTNAKEFDIEEINNTSETGGIYVTAGGRILDTFEKYDENLAKYKIVPTGLKFRYSEYPLFASFIKLNGQWEGCFLGTGTMLFEMYKQHYGKDFDTTYTEVFGGENRKRDITGFGLSRLNSSDVDDVVYSSEEISEDKLSNQLEVAISRLQNQVDKQKSSKKTSHKTKAQRKAERLKKHLEKVKEQERREQLAKEAEAKRMEAVLKLKDELERTENGIVWTNVVPMEAVHSDFIDAQTEELNKKIENYVNSDTNEQSNNLSEEEASTEFNDVMHQVVSDAMNVTEEQTSKDFEKNSEYSIKADTCTDVELDCENESDIIAELDHSNVQREFEKYKIQLKNDIINDIYERLLIKENWKLDNKNRLGFYLKGICFYIWREIRNSNSIRGNGYTLSNDGKHCIINTGLMDSYGNFIYLVDHSPSIPDFYSKVISIMYNKVELLKLNFDIENAKHMPLPIKFIEDKSELIFDAEYDDFDLDDTSHLYHIIKERIGRFPDKYSTESPLTICEKLKSAIRQAIMISKTDYKYIIPKYDFSRKQIQFLIPFYLDNTLDSAPELTIVVGRQSDGMWSIYTVLHTDDAYDDARLLSRASDSWLNISNTKEDK